MLNQETRAPRLRVYGADRTRRHPTSQSPGHRVPDLCNHPRSSAPDLLLLPRSSSLHVKPHLPRAHHETSKRDSPNETKIKVKQINCPEFEFKPHQVTESSQSNQGIDNLVSQVLSVPHYCIGMKKISSNITTSHPFQSSSLLPIGSLPFQHIHFSELPPLAVYYLSK
jgi:hypothetical protein